MLEFLSQISCASFIQSFNVGYLRWLLEILLYKLVLNFLILLALIVIVLGAYAKLTDSDLGCTYWTGCYGYIGVPSDATGTGF